MKYRKAILTLILHVVLFPLSNPNSVRADSVELRSGVRMRGEFQSLPKNSGDHYTTAITPTGCRIVIETSQIANLTKRSSLLEKYEAKNRTCDQTVESHQKIADWCLQENILAKRAVHLKAILTLKPNYELVKEKLKQLRSSGEFNNQKSLNQEIAFARYRGKFLTQQQIEVAQEEEKLKELRESWAAKLNYYRLKPVGFQGVIRAND